MNSQNNKTPWPYKKNFQNQFGLRSHLEDHINFGQHQKAKTNSNYAKGSKDSMTDKSGKAIESIFENVDMIMSSQKLDDRLSQLNRIRTSINCNEFVRLPILIAAILIGIVASVHQKELLPDIIEVETQLLALQSSQTEDQDSKLSDVALFSQEIKSKIWRIQTFKKASFVLSFLFTFLTINYYRLSVFKLGKLRDGVYQPPVNWVSILIKCGLAFLHSQASYRYRSTFTMGSQNDDNTSNDESPQSLLSNSRIFYVDIVLTSIMVIVRSSYFFPKIIMRLYCLLVEEDSEITKSKNRYILSEVNGMQNEEWQGGVLNLFKPSQTSSHQIRGMVLKNIWLNQPSPILLICFCNIFAYSAILYLFMNPSSYELQEFQKTKMQRNDTYFEALFTTSNLWFRQQYRSRSLKFFTQKPDKEPEKQGFDLEAYCTQQLQGGQDGNEATKDSVDPICLGLNFDDEIEVELPLRFKLQWYTYKDQDQPWLVKNETDVFEIKYQTTRVYWENNMQLLVMSLFSIGSVIFTTFLTNLLISSLNLKGQMPISHDRIKHLMIDILQDQRGLIRCYSAGLIQAFHRIKKYQRLCEFPDHHGKVRPGITNKSLYQTNKSLLKQNIALFKRNQFLIKQYNLMKRGVDKGAPEYYWGLQPFSKSVPRRQQTLLYQGLQDLQTGVFDKLRLKTLLILNQDINKASLDSTLKNQDLTISMLKRKLEAIKQTEFFLNKLQLQYLKVDKDDCLAEAYQNLPRSRQSNHKMVIRSIDQIDQFPEILSQTSVRKLSERDCGIIQEKFLLQGKNETTERVGGKRRRSKSPSKERASVGNDSATEKGGKNQSDGYSNNKKGKVDVPSIKKKLRAMRDKLQRDLDGISEEGYQDDDMTGRQVNILISSNNGRVGFEQGTKYKRSKTKKAQGKGSNRSSKRGSSTSKSPSIKRSKTVSQNNSPDKQSGLVRSPTKRASKEQPIISEGQLQLVPEKTKKQGKKANDSRLKDRGQNLPKMRASKGALTLAGGGIFMPNENAMI